MSNLTATDYRKMNARKRRQNDRKYLQHLKSLWQKLGGSYPCPVTPRDKNREYTEDNENISYFEQEWRDQSSKQLKKQYNRRLRNADKEEVYQHGEYKRKSGDFWWDYC